MVLVSSRSPAELASFSRHYASVWKAGGLRGVRVAVVGDVWTAAGSLYLTAKETSCAGLSRRLMRLLMALNPELELRADVHALLRALVDVQVQALFQARKFDHSILRAIIVMAAPSQDTAVVFTRMLDSVVELTSRLESRGPHSNSYSGAELVPARASQSRGASADIVSRALKLAALSRRRRPAVEAGEAKRVWQSGGPLPLTSASVQLITRFRADSRAVIALRRGGAEAVVATLTEREGAAWPSQLCLPDAAAGGRAGDPCDSGSDSGGASSSGSDAEDDDGPVVCPITLEPILSPTGHLLPDTAALLQRDHRGRLRAYLFRGSALLEWIRMSPTPTNPATRSPVSLEDIFQLR